MSEYFVYIMTNRSGTLYTGVTNNLMRRVLEHKTGSHDGFTRRYQISRLVYYESTTDVRVAIEREKQLKGWLRKRKIELIKEMNPHWLDLSEGWYDREMTLETMVAGGQILRAAQNDIVSKAVARPSIEKGTAHV